MPERTLLEIRLESLFNELTERATKITELKNYETAPKRFKDFIEYVQEAVKKARADVKEYFTVPPPPTWEEVSDWVTSKHTGTYLVLYREDEIVKRLMVDRTAQFETLTVKYQEQEIQVKMTKRTIAITLPDGTVLEKPAPKGIDSYRLLTAHTEGKGKKAKTELSEGKVTVES